MRQKVDALLEDAVDEHQQGVPNDLGLPALDWLVENWDLSLGERASRGGAVPVAAAAFTGPARRTDADRAVPRTGRDRAQSLLFPLSHRPRGERRVVPHRGPAGGGAGRAAMRWFRPTTTASCSRCSAFRNCPWSSGAIVSTRRHAEADLRLALKESELVRWQFRGVAQTGLMVPRQFPGQQRAVRQLRFSAEILFRVLEEHEPDHPMLEEAYRQSIDHWLNSAWCQRLDGKNRAARIGLGVWW